MLRYLRISNLAVISDVEIECEPGLNLLTGETGSGKSIIVDALSLLLGARAQADFIRSGETTAFVEGLFLLSDGQSVPTCMGEAGIIVADGEILIRRILERNGPTRAFVNDRLVTASLLRELRPSLIDILGQGDHQTLLSPASQMVLLDRVAEAEGIRDEVNRIYGEYVKRKIALGEITRSEAERLRLMDVYEYQIAEIERVNPACGEDDELERQRRVLRQAEKLTRLTTEAYQSLYEADESILSSVAMIQGKIEELGEIDAAFNVALEHLDRAKASLEETAFFLRDYMQESLWPSDSLERVDDRLAEIHRLKRKYGPRIEDVLSKLEEMRRELVRLESSEEVRGRTEQELAELERAYLRVARDLTEKRTKAARFLERAVVGEMGELALETGQVAVMFRPASKIPAENGLERVEFMASLNPGEELKPLSRVASGGEMSRLMLAIKSVAAKDAGPVSLVFDEIDVGIGGRVAERVGQRLKQLAQTHQVFCVTHQPQIARFANVHFQIEKTVADGRTIVSVQKLDQLGQVNELARMMAGAEITTATRRHARELLQSR